MALGAAERINLFDVNDPFDPYRRLHQHQSEPAHSHQGTEAIEFALDNALMRRADAEEYATQQLDALIQQYEPRNLLLSEHMRRRTYGQALEDVEEEEEGERAQMDEEMKDAGVGAGEVESELD